MSAVADLQGARLRDELRGLTAPFSELSESLGKTCVQLASMSRALGSASPPQPSALDQLADAVVVSDTNGRIIRSNLAAKAVHPMLAEGCIKICECGMNLEYQALAELEHVLSEFRKARP